ncbi:MAG: DEAD/DEAH box helicase [Antricoccus sp.]
MTSPAQAYSAARRRAKYPELATFASGYLFALDDFQTLGCEALEEGLGVLVCAPTGAGKTVVGEFAVHLALSRGLGCAYTTPIKALSNQKYADLVRRHGSANVGLLTGDNSINPTAPILVMTTEVLRNMLYVGSEVLDRLGYVVMDEVHYLADRFRGAVWEEVIIHLAEHVQLVSLSATVSNAEEFGQWLQEVRGATAVVVSEERPVPLWQHMMVGNRLYDLLDSDIVGRTSAERRGASRELIKAAQNQSQRTNANRNLQSKWRPPRRADVVERLERSGLLPAIYFIFSRVGCDAAVEQCIRSGIRLIDDQERAQVREIVAARTAELSDSDLQVLGYWEWIDGLERGVAAHHAGLIPIFKETVEELFLLGLCQIVFATETLALGINMPARAVVLERMIKYNGETHNRLTPGEYTQLTGRAGRRGIDVEGHAVVLWGPQLDPVDVAGLATTRTFPLISSFTPSYNMSVNLIAQLGRINGRALLERSFAQFQADRGVVGLVKARDRAASKAADQSGTVECDLGDVDSYAQLRRSLGEREKGAAKARSGDRRDRVTTSVAALRRGDIIAVPSGRHRGVAVVLESVPLADEPRLMVLSETKWAGRIPLRDFNDAVQPLGRMKVNKQFAHRSAQARRDLAAHLITVTRDLPKRHWPPADHRGADPERDRLRAALSAHHVHQCPDRDRHVREFENARAAQLQVSDLDRQVADRTTSLGRTFDHICRVLAELGYVQAEGAEYSVTNDGRLLSRLWSESDLLIADCLRRGTWDELSAPELAAVVASVLYESRSKEQFHTAQVPVGSRAVRTALAHCLDVWQQINAIARTHHAPTIREPDPGFCLAAYRWVVGDSLQVVLQNLARAGVELSPGDFVRWCRQIIDVLDQISRVPVNVLAPALMSTAAAAANAMRRGVLVTISDATEQSNSAS